MIHVVRIAEGRYVAFCVDTGLLVLGRWEIISASLADVGIPPSHIQSILQELQYQGISASQKNCLITERLH